MSIHAVIAVRGGAQAKTRCAPGLDEAGRAELVRAMMLDMIAALLAAPRIDQVEVVTPTPELAKAARGAGALAVLEPRALGINAALESARARLRAVDGAAVMAALPGDLPLLDPAELDPAFDLAGPGRAVLIPALADGGTGAVVARADAPFAFAFGADSFRRHWAAVERAGLEPVRLDAPSLGLDIDRPQDLAAVGERQAGGHTTKFLARRLKPTEALP